MCDESDEIELCRRFTEGDDCAFTELVKRYQAQLVNYVRRLIRWGSQDAEDVAQNILLKAWNGRSTFNASHPFANWLFTIAYNETVSYFRRNGRTTPTVNLGDVEDPLDATEASRAAERELQEMFEECCLKVLSSNEAKTAIALRFQEDLTYSQAASRMGKSEQQFNGILNRALTKLRVHWEQEHSGRLSIRVFDTSMRKRNE